MKYARLIMNRTNQRTRDFVTLGVAEVVFAAAVMNRAQPISCECLNSVSAALPRPSHQVPLFFHHRSVLWHRGSDRLRFSSTDTDNRSRSSSDRRRPQRLGDADLRGVTPSCRNTSASDIPKESS